jgi:hypothetical protein
MMGFVMGLVLGALGKLFYDRYSREPNTTATSADMQRRANAVLDESRQILQEVRGELSRAAGTARESASTKLERLRGAAIAADDAPVGHDMHNVSDRQPVGAAAGANGQPVHPTVSNVPSSGDAAHLANDSTSGPNTTVSPGGA